MINARFVVICRGRGYDYFPCFIEEKKQGSLVKGSIMCLRAYGRAHLQADTASFPTSIYEKCMHLWRKQKLQTSLSNFNV